MRVDELLFKLENPQVYTGKEINAINKGFDKDRVNICLVFPDKYEIGMSHYGIKVLYHTLNRIKDVNAERCFLPEKKSINTFKKYNVPLFSLENKIPLKDFDLIGFSLLSEMNYTNVLQILELSQLPLKSDQRNDTFPLVAAGGICSVNPEPMREFIDCFAIGDGEVIFPDIIRLLLEGKRKKSKKEELLNSLEKIDSIYVPYYSPVKKTGRFYTPIIQAGRVKKRILKDLNNGIPDEKVIVPLTNVVFNRLDVEIARGCPENCRFCQAKSYYSPFRVKSFNKTLYFINQALKQTGFESFSLLSLSSGDYPYLNDLLKLIPDVINPCISFSVSSLRPSTISDNLLKTLALFRRTGITIVPEAGSERLRRIINKNVSNEEIFKAVDLALKYEWEKIKLYFMIGLPRETEEDVHAIVELFDRIMELVKSKKKKIKIHASFSPFVPKPHTPFQWEKMEDLNSIFEKIDHLKKNLKKYRNLDLDFHDPRNSAVEAILARGDFRAGKIIQEAFNKNEIYSAWDKDFNFSIWDDLIKRYSADEFLKEISTGETLPWDFIDVNYTKDYMLSEYKKIESGIPTYSCSDMDCYVCEGCNFRMNREFTIVEEDPFVPDAPVKKIAEFNKVRIFYQKTGDFRFFSQLSMLKYVERLIRKSGIRFRCTEGFHPRIKISSLPPLPVYATSLAEVIELYLDAGLKESEILNRLNVISDDFKFLRVQICNSAPSLSKDIQFIEYEIYGKNLDSKLKIIKESIVPSESISYSDFKLFLRMDYSTKGQDRFSRIYRILDPDKKSTANLTRKNVIFRCGL